MSLDTQSLTKESEIYTGGKKAALVLLKQNIDILKNESKAVSLSPCKTIQNTSKTLAKPENESAR